VPQPTCANSLTVWLAVQKMSEKPQVVNQYESGAAVPNNQVLGKMERILGVKLRGAPGPVGGGKKKKK
jgi:putative transcription factor